MLALERRFGRPGASKLAALAAKSTVWDVKLATLGVKMPTAAVYLGVGSAKMAAGGVHLEGFCAPDPFESAKAAKLQNH